MSAEINRDNNPETNGSAAQVFNAPSSSSQCPRQATSLPSSSDCPKNILPGMHGIGIAHEANRVTCQNSHNVESSTVLSPASQHLELKCGDVTGDGPQISPTLDIPELSHKSGEQREALLQLHVEQLQKVLQEQARLLSLLSPGIMLAPVLPAQRLGSTPALISTNHPDVKSGSPSVTLPDGVRPPSESMTCCLVPANHNSDEITRKGRAEQSNLSPIREEPVEQPYSVSPFGIRRTLPVNPEDRPIRPAVGERRKTFEDFLEEQVRVDETSLSEANQTNTNIHVRNKKFFLRKGFGKSRIGKSKFSIPDSLRHTEQPRFTKKLQRLTTFSNEFSGKMSMPEYAPVTRKFSGGIEDSRESTDAQNMGQISTDKNETTKWEDVEKCVNAATGHIDSTLEGNKCPVSRCQTSMNHGPASHAAKNEKKHTHDHVQYNNSRRNSLRQTSTTSDGRAAPGITAQTAGDAVFKKINDHIVQVCQRAPHCIESESDRSQCGAKPDESDMLSLATELMQSLHTGTSSESSSEEDPESQCHRYPMTPTPSAFCQKDQNLDLSDGDYASDAPSETGACPTAQPRTSPTNDPRLSSSSEASDSELKRLNFNRTSTSKNQAEFKSASASQLLASIFPKIKPADNRTFNDKQKEKFLSSKDNRCGERAPVRTQRDLIQAFRVQEVKHDTLLDELKYKQDKAMQFLRDGSRNPEKSTRGEMDHGVAQLQQQVVAMQEQLQQKEREWSEAHGQLQSSVNSLIRDNQELRGKLTFTGPASQTSPHLNQPVVNANKQQTSSKLMSAGLHPRSPTPAFNKPSDHHKAAPSRMLVSNHTFHASVQRTKGQRPSTPFRMSSAKSRSPEGKQSLDTPHSRSQNNGRKVSWMSEDSHGKLWDCPDRSCTPVSRQTPLLSQTSSSGSDHMDNSNPSAPQDMKDNVRQEVHYPDGKVEKILSSGCRVVIYRNGTKKEISTDEKSVTITFFNGDVKQILPDGKVVYYYHDAQATHTIFPSGLEVLHFANNQTEEHHPDGSRQIIFPDGTIKHIFADGREESTFPDGTVVKLTENGEKSVDFTNGQREIHTSLYKRREYPEGAVKTVYWNGTQETTYSSGKVRIRNNVIDRV